MMSGGLQLFQARPGEILVKQFPVFSDFFNFYQNLHDFLGYLPVSLLWYSSKQVIVSCGESWQPDCSKLEN